MHSITCVGKDGMARQFIFDDPEVEDTYEGFHELSYCIKTHPEAPHFFGLQLRQLNCEFQIIAIEHHHVKDYASKGIPDALLPFLSKSLGQPIRSSRGYVPGTNEWRSVDATKMWKRLVDKGLARYHGDEDIYRTI